MMPRYFFDIHDGRDILDERGTELPSVEAARLESVRFAADLLRDNPEHFWKGEDWRVEVYDQTRRILFSLNFTATVATTD